MSQSCSAFFFTQTAPRARPSAGAPAKRDEEKMKKILHHCFSSAKLSDEISMPYVLNAYWYL